MFSMVKIILLFLLNVNLIDALRFINCPRVPSFVALHRCFLFRSWLPFATPHSASSLPFSLSLMPDYNQISGFLSLSLHLSSHLSFLLLSLFLYLYPFLPLVVVSYSSLILFSLLFVIPLLFFFIFLSLSLIPS